jgi:hypothetical protein
LSVLVFLIATIAAKGRGLDITCGCFGHASEHWSFGLHVAVDLGILAALICLWFMSNRNDTLEGPGCGRPAMSARSAL